MFTICWPAKCIEETDGETGYSVRTGNAERLSEAIYKIYSDPDLQKTMGIAAKERVVQHFNNQATVEKTLALYQEVMRGK